MNGCLCERHGTVLFEAQHQSNIGGRERTREDIRLPMKRREEETRNSDAIMYELCNEKLY